ncbi:MAG: NAD(P)H-dependent oxidoreductase subunit E [Anaerofustis stercorihominis]|nr:NAD(P)H-dependent oxidoreductase subunit E [Anaerofustis stercorihominis]
MSKQDTITNFDAVKKIVATYRDMPGCLMTILQKTQDVYGYLPFELQNAIAEELDIPVSEVYGVATFYSQFSLVKKGDYLISVCLGTACYVKSSQLILERLALELNIPVGSTTEDYKFTLEPTRCLGCCGLAPVMTINEDVYGGIVPNDIPDILAKY